MVMIPVNHLEQVLRGLILMRQDETPQAFCVRSPVIETPSNVSRAALLPALQDQRSDLAGFGPLRFQSFVDVLLRAVEDQRLDLAGLGPDLQMLLGKVTIWNNWPNA
jgi:hypothetical protein